MIICSQSTGRAIQRACASLHSNTSICSPPSVQADTDGEISTIRRVQSRSCRRFPSKTMTSSSPSSGEHRIFSPPGLPPTTPFNVFFMAFAAVFFRLCTVYRRSTEQRRKQFFGYEPRDGRRWPRNLTSSSIRSCQLSLNLLNVRADVIGDQIVLVLVELRIHIPESDAICLVDWKRGRMTLVSRACLIMQYGMGASAEALVSTLQDHSSPLWPTTARYAWCLLINRKSWTVILLRAPGVER
ncbi:hypothetical protein F5888DRAFT_1352364 [Russula emetica]|nr:hypothetical protein F5888DRAFT_1352364 [Russula emetica]